MEENISGKYKQTMTHHFSNQCEVIDKECDLIIPITNKKKLKEFIEKQDNDIFLFMRDTEKIPEHLSIAQALFEKYKYHSTIQPDILRSISYLLLDPFIQEINKKLQNIKGSHSVDDLMKQLLYLEGEYKKIGDEVLSLEKILLEKIKELDKNHYKVKLILQLENNELLPEVIESFSKYSSHVYKLNRFEETYTKLIEAYKKWNIYRHILSSSNIMKETIEIKCTICMLNKISHTIVPCGHTYCKQCSQKQNIMCYICRGMIREKVKLYI